MMMQVAFSLVWTADIVLAGLQQRNLQKPISGEKQTTKPEVYYQWHN